jgi:hypothetical protein
MIDINSILLLEWFLIAPKCRRLFTLRFLIGDEGDLLQKRGLAVRHASEFIVHYLE